MSPLALLELLLPPGQRMRCNQPSSPLPPRARQAPASSAPARPACAALLLLALWCLAPAAPAQGNSAAGPAPNTSAEARALDLGLGGSGGSSGCNPTLQSCVPPPSDGGTGSPGGSCGPSPGGGTSACNSAGPASMGNSSGTQQGAGNPIHLISGNKYLREVDLPALPGVLGLEIVRHYNSAYSLPNSPLSLLGRGWRLSYETQLRVGPTALQILQADGTRLIFQRQAHNPALCASTDPANGVVTEQAPASGLPQHTRYLWRWPDGRQLLFDHAGLLLSITAPSGETLTLAYDAKGWLRKVTDPQGRSLLLHTTPRPSALADLRQGKDQFMGLQRISSPVGDFHYAHAAALPAGSEHDSALMLGTLSEVSLPAPAGQPPLRRLYHHEDPTFPTLITGISVTVSTSTSSNTNNKPASAASSPALQRLSTYAYNSRGKAILSTLANGVQRVSLSHPGPGITVLTNSLGQTTTYRHAIVHNQWRLLEALGPGCSTCGPSNVRYGYDALGRLTLITQLSPLGRPVSSVRTTLDPQGRTVRTERFTYSAQGRPQSPVLIARYEYPDAPAVAPAGLSLPSLPAPGGLLPFPTPA